MKKNTLRVFVLVLALAACSKKKGKDETITHVADTAIERTVNHSQAIVQPDTLTFNEKSKLSADELKKYGIKTIRKEELKGLEVFSLKGNIKLFDTLNKSAVKILLFNENGEYVSQGAINKDGAVALHNIKPDNYTVVLSKPKYRSQNDLSVIKSEKQALIRAQIEHADAYAVGNYLTDADIKNHLFARVEKDSLIVKKSATITGTGKPNTSFLLVAKSGKILRLTNPNAKGTFQFTELNADQHYVVIHPNSVLSTGKVNYITNTGHVGWTLLSVGQKLTEKELAYNTVAHIQVEHLLDNEIYGTLLDKATRNYAKNETVWLADHTGTIIRKEQTRVDGNVDFKELSEHNYYVLVSKGQSDFVFNLSEKHAAGNGTAQGLYDRAVKKVAKNDFAGAEKLLNKALELNPKFYEAYMLKGEIEDNASRYNEALNNYNKALEVKPNDINALYKRGIMRIELEQYGNAISDFDKVISRDPKFSQAYFHRGVAKSNQGKHQLAILDYQKMVTLDPKASDGYFNLGSSYFELKNYDEAISNYDKSLRIDSLDAETHMYKGLSYQIKGKNNIAVTHYDKAISINNNYEAYLHKAEILENEREFTELETLYAKAIAAHPVESETFYHRGVFYANRKKYDQALGDLSKAIAINAKVGLYYADRAKIFLKKDMKNEACTDVAMAKELGHTIESKLERKSCK